MGAGGSLKLIFLKNEEDKYKLQLTLSKSRFVCERIQTKFGPGKYWREKKLQGELKVS